MGVLPHTTEVHKAFCMLGLVSKAHSQVHQSGVCYAILSTPYAILVLLTQVHYPRILT